MQRENWKFEYTATKLHAAAQEKIDFHDERLAFWVRKREEIIASIRSDGIEVDEKIALTYANPKFRDWNDGGEILIRNDLKKDLAEAYKKLAYHTRERDTYDGWRQLLEANPEKCLSLEIDDWLFFFGRDTGKD